MKKRERIFIIPNGFGLMYGAGIIASLIGGGVYNNNLSFALCFFLVALFLIAMVQTHSNLKKIDIEKLQIFPSPDHDEGKGVLWIKSQNSEGHGRLRIQFSSQDEKFDFLILKIPPRSLHSHYFGFVSGDWGVKKISKLRVSTTFPFGLFYVWRIYQLDQSYFIYPSPHGNQSLESFFDGGEVQNQSHVSQGEDFSHHRDYQQGDSLKHIDWKAYARERPLMTKIFSEGNQNHYVLDVDLARGSFDEKLRQLSQWIHDCETQRQPYALRIGNQKIDFGQGQEHKIQCLVQLAHCRNYESSTD
ncbi:MAG: DUF58 domain-containing protein [Bdellovibrionales bacterium]|nr:DUF58 domain-containing protein [Bdellovibrionales bacterium]